MKQNTQYPDSPVVNYSLICEYISRGIDLVYNFNKTMDYLLSYDFCQMHEVHSQV
jgi:hypothetical protein